MAEQRPLVAADQGQAGAERDGPHTAALAARFPIPGLAAVTAAPGACAMRPHDNAAGLVWIEDNAGHGAAQLPLHQLPTLASVG